LNAFLKASWNLSHICSSSDTSIGSWGHWENERL